jgi:hypothetical protein
LQIQRLSAKFWLAQISGLKPVVAKLVVPMALGGNSGLKTTFRRELELLNHFCRILGNNIEIVNIQILKTVNCGLYSRCVRHLFRNANKNQVQTYNMAMLSE